MVLVDTSIWIEHFRQIQPALVQLLNTGQVCTHPFIIGELACGCLKNPEKTIALLKNIPMLTLATDDETLYFIQHHQLMGCGIGYIDAHLLASTALNETTTLWTQDKRLQRQANRLGLAHVVLH